MEAVVVLRPATDGVDDQITSVTCRSTSNEQTFTAVPTTGAVVTVSVGQLTNGVRTRIWCHSNSKYGAGPGSPESQEVTPGIPLSSMLEVSTSSLSNTPLSFEAVRIALATQLNVNQANVIVEGSIQQTVVPEHQCHDEKAGAVTVVQFKVMMQDAQDPSLSQVMAAVTQLEGNQAFATALSASTVRVVAAPTLASPEFIDSSLKALTVTVDGKTQKLVPTFSSQEFNYEVNVTGMTYEVSAIQNSDLALEVKIDQSGTPKVTYKVTEVAPKSRLVSAVAVAGDQTQSTYSVRVFLQPRQCSSCGNGTCDSLSGECTCMPGFFETACQVHCPGETPCSGRGTCTMFDASSGGCVCDETFAGVDCAERTCPVCQHGGACAPGNQNLTSTWGCTCTSQNYGDRCEGFSCSGACSGAGDCNLKTGSCTCFPGHGGMDCSVRQDAKEPIHNTIDVYMVWGIKTYSEQNTSQPVLETSFDYSNPATQAYIQGVISSTRNNSDLKLREELKSFPETFQETLISLGIPFPLSVQGTPEILGLLTGTSSVKDATKSGTTDKTSSGEEQDRRLAEQSQNDTLLHVALASFFENPTMTALYSSDVGTTGPRHTGKIFYVRAKMKINIKQNTAPHELLPDFEKWEAYIEQLNKNAPDDLKVLLVSNSFTQMKAELSVVESTISSFVCSVALTMATVLIFTGNLVIALYTVITIILTVSTLFGVLVWVLNWEFGAIQAVAVILFVGLSVDYCLHLGHSYNESIANTRLDRMTEALSQLGTAVLGGALTTLGSVVFLWPCYIYLFVQLGMMIFANMLLATLYTFLFLAPLLMVAGPTGHWSSIYSLLLCRPCRRMRDQKRRASKKGVVSGTPSTASFKGAASTFTKPAPVPVTEINDCPPPPKTVQDCRGAVASQVGKSESLDREVPGGDSPRLQPPLSRSPSAVSNNPDLGGLNLEFDSSSSRLRFGSGSEPDSLDGGLNPEVLGKHSRDDFASV